MPKLGDRSSTDYKFTVTDLNDAKLLELKKTISAFNKLNIQKYERTYRAYEIVNKKYRVVVKGRFGNDNTNIEHYQYRRKDGTIKTNYKSGCKISHAQRFDVYVREV